MIKHLFLLLCIMIPAFAASGAECESTTEATQNEKSATDDTRARWFKEARELKHQFLAKELQLTKEQQKDFFDLYDRMEDETTKVQRETRQMEKNVASLGDQATDLDYEKATDALYEAKQKEASIEQRYKEEFKKILSSRQLFLLKGAERRFTKTLMERHQKLKGNVHGKPQK